MKPSMLTQLLGFFYLVMGLLLLLNALSALLYQSMVMVISSVIVAAWCLNKYLTYLLGMDVPGGGQPDHGPLPWLRSTSASSSQRTSPPEKTPPSPPSDPH